MTSTVATRNAVPRGGVVLFAVTAVVITVTLALGSTVCATDASASCPNWPGCYVGRLTPLDATQPWVEFIHRVISASIGLLAVASRPIEAEMTRWMNSTHGWVASNGVRRPT